MPKETNKEKALNALLNTNSITDAAKACKLSEATIYRYLEDANFKAEYNAARRKMFEQNIFKMQSLHNEAVETLKRNLYCENASVEVRAAQIIVEGNRKDFENFDVLERLENLEANQKE
ncbi:MAG: hypothetical protein M3405_01875 [Acidobacteriota bacterium]|jgi:transposase|nr:hypothetical protein [Acidobacteriota bacterium]